MHLLFRACGIYIYIAVSRCLITLSQRQFASSLPGLCVRCGCGPCMYTSPCIYRRQNYVLGTAAAVSSIVAFSPTLCNRSWPEYQRRATPRSPEGFSQKQGFPEGFWGGGPVRVKGGAASAETSSLPRGSPLSASFCFGRRIGSSLQTPCCALLDGLNLLLEPYQFQLLEGERGVQLDIG